MSTAAPARSATPVKAESLVEHQFQRAHQRIRWLDATAAVLGLTILTLLYGLSMMYLDRVWDLPSQIRQWTFVAGCSVMSVYLAVFLVRPLLRRINPYYAARQMEATLPEAKNSLVNWLDFRGQSLPSAIRTAVSQRAARDVVHADLDQAISARRTGWLGAIATALLLALFVQFVMGGRQFSSLFGRAFAPFIESSIQTRTQIELLQPAEGDITVTVGRAVSFLVQVTGKIPQADKPDALRLLYRYHLCDPYEEQRLERGDVANEWTTMIPAYQVHNGFCYKVAGGDAETPEHQVKVRSTPLLTSFEVDYHFRPYLDWANLTTQDPNLKAMRGTEATLVARTNRNIKEARLDLTEAKKSIAAELVAGEPDSMRFKLVLDRDDSYRIWFTSTDGDRNVEPMAYEIKVLRDQAPQVVISSPGKDITLPVNGTLQLKGLASDDFAVTGLKLHMRLGDKEPLLAKPYRKGKPLRRADGNWPQQLDYNDLVALDALKLASGEPLVPGAVLEYWLEAADNCDYPPPGPNVGRSERFKVTLTERQSEDQKKQERQRALQQQEQHEQKQNQDLANDRQKSNADDQKNQQPQQKQEPQSPEEQKFEQEKEKLRNALDQQEGNKTQKQNQTADDKRNENNNDQNQTQGGSASENKQQGADKKNKNDGKKNDQDRAGEKNDSGQGNSAEDKKGDKNAQQNKQTGDPSNQQQQGADQRGNDQVRTGDKDETKKNDAAGSSEKHKDEQGNSSAEKKNGDQQSNQQSNQQKDSTEKKNSETGAESPKSGPDAKPTQGQLNGTKDKDQSHGSQGTKEQPDKDQKGANQKQGAGNSGQSTGQEKGQEKSVAKKPTGNSSTGGEKDDDGTKSKSDENAGGGSSNPERNSRKSTDQGDGQSTKQNARGSESTNEAGTKDPQENRSGTGKNDAKDKSNEAGPNQKSESSKGQDKKNAAGTDPMNAQQPKKDETNAANSDAQRNTDTSNAGQPKKEQSSESAQGQEKAKAKSQSNNNKAKSDANRDPMKSVTNDPASKPNPPEKGQGATEKRNAPNGKDETKEKTEAQQQLENKLKDLADQSKNSDPNARKQLQERLEQMRKESRDPQETKALDKLLDALRERSQKQPESQSPKPSPAETRNESGKPTPSGPGEGKTQDHKAQGETRNQNSQDQSGASKKPGAGNPPDKGQGNVPSENKGAEKSQTGAPGQQTPGGGTPGNAAGRGTDGERRGNMEANDSSPGNQEATAADPRFQAKAGELQLEEFKKRVTKDVLQKANMTEAEYQQFIKAYEAMLKRKSSRAAKDSEKLVDPKRRGGSLKNTGPGRVQGVQGKDDRLQTGGPTQAPPEYRDAYKEFTEKLSNLERNKSK